MSCGEKQYQLRWTEHSSSTVSSLSGLLDASHLVDVALTSADGVMIHAHRLVLAACSGYFRRLFRDVAEPRVVVVFKDAPQQVIRDMIVFMYKGEVDVREEHLADFLKLAETLEVKGLSHKHDTTTTSTAPSLQDVSNSLLSNAFPHPMFLPSESNLLNQLSSPNLYHALQRTVPDPENSLLKHLPLMKQMLEGKAPPLLSSSDLASMYPNMHSLVPEEKYSQNGIEADQDAPMENDSSDNSKAASSGSDQDPDGSGEQRPRPRGRGSRLKRMMAAESKVLSQFTAPGAERKELSVVTPELMKSRRTHSLQLAIKEILNKRASVQSAATKFQIPRETLRRHYQRYIKATGGANKKRDLVESVKDVNDVNDVNDGKEAFSSLLDIGRAYGIFGAEESKLEESAAEEKLVIDEDDDDDVSEEEEELGQDAEN